MGPTEVTCHIYPIQAIIREKNPKKREISSVTFFPTLKQGLIAPADERRRVLRTQPFLPNTRHAKRKKRLGETSFRVSPIQTLGPARAHHFLRHRENLLLSHLRVFDRGNNVTCYLKLNFLYIKDRARRGRKFQENQFTKPAHR